MLLRITAIQIDNFRSYARPIRLTFNQARTLIVGHNNAGKSTIADAIKWALLGTTTGLDAAGRGLDQLAFSKERPMTIALELEGLGTVRRSANFTTRKQDLILVRIGEDGEETPLAAGGVREVQAAILDRLGVTPEILSAVLDFGSFLELDHAAGKALLLRLLDVRVPIGGESLTLDQVESRYASAVENRKAAKRRLEDMGEPAEPTPPELRPIEAIRADLAALKTAGTEAFAEQNQRAGERRRVDTEIEKLKRDLAAFDRRIGDHDLEALEAEVGRLEVARAQITTPDQTEALARIQAAAEARGELGSLGAVLEQLRAQSRQKTCVLDAAIPCKTPAKFFKDKTAALEARHATLTTTIDESDAVVKATREATREASSKLDAVDRELSAKRSTVSLLKVDTERREVVRARLLELARDAEDLAAGETENAADVNQAAGEIQDLESKLEIWTRYQRKREEFDKAMTAIQGQAARVRELEATCEELGPKGARVKALGDALETFTARTNHHLQRFGRFVTIELEPWKVLVQVGEEAPRPAAVLSTSERMRTGIALQLAVSAFSGLGFAFIDEAELLDESNNAALARMVLEVKGGQIIVASTRDQSYALPEVDGLQVFRLGLVDHVTRVLEVRSGALAPVA